MADFYQSGKNFDEGLYVIKSISRISLAIMVLVFSGCVYSHSTYDEKKFKIAAEASYDASIIAGSIMPYDSSNHQIYYQVAFDKVNGGTSYLFGIWKYNEVSGNKVERLIFKKGEETLRYSIKDLENASSSNAIIQVPIVPK